jgi:hypothetical protein
MSSYVSTELRTLVVVRAGGVCEYCLIHERDTYLGCQVDHVISEKHGGPTEEWNLAFACAFCNRSKGSDIGSLSIGTRQYTRFFNPRVDRWSEHFRLQGVVIMPLTAESEVTVAILGLNRPERVLERLTLAEHGHYPPSEAIRRLG